MRFSRVGDKLYAQMQDLKFGVRDLKIINQCKTVVLFILSLFRAIFKT